MGRWLGAHRRLEYKNGAEGRSPLQLQSTDLQERVPVEAQLFVKDLRYSAATAAAAVNTDNVDATAATTTLNDIVYMGGLTTSTINKTAAAAITYNTA